MTPTRLYKIAVAAVPLAAYFLPSAAWPLVLSLIAAVLGVGEAVERRQLRSDLVELHDFRRWTQAEYYRGGYKDGHYDGTQGAPKAPPTAGAQG